MATYPFLSEEWLSEARRIREEYRGRTPPVPHQVTMNQVITDVPFGTGSIESHMDTTSGDVEFELGHLPAADVTVTVDYATAKAIFVDQDPAAGINAFMNGKLVVQGDMAKLLAMQQGSVDPLALEVAARVKEITA